MLAIFFELNSKGLHQSLGKERESCCLLFPSSTKRENRQFHVVVMQRWQKNVQKKSDINSLLFSNWATWDIIAKLFERMWSLFQRPFKGRRRCRMVRSLLGRLRVRDLA